MEHYMEILRQFGVVMSVAGGIIGVILSFIVFFVFMSKKNRNRFHGFFGWLYDYLHFKNFIIEGLLKFFYVLGVCVCTMVGIFNILCLQMVFGFAVLVFGNLILRILYEFALMIVVICRNVSEINKKMGGDVDYRTQFKECEIPPMPKKEDFIKRDSQAVRETAAARPEPAEAPRERILLTPKSLMHSRHARPENAPAEARKQEMQIGGGAANLQPEVVPDQHAQPVNVPPEPMKPVNKQLANTPPEVIQLGDQSESVPPEVMQPQAVQQENVRPVDVEPQVTWSESDAEKNEQPLSGRLFDIAGGRCPDCGRPVKKGDLFCGQCGRKLEP